ncbi:MAG: carboxylesterase family protein, partial [Clostridia bacterium]|nr:carboxylesterase family protein [Clostridia bacterium]
MEKIYGENKEITGDYDNELSAACNNGIFVGTKKDDVISFKGIPYAKPPTGDLRWKDPILAEDDTKVYEAYYFGKTPIQTEKDSDLGTYYPKSEDCLYLNIRKNSKDTSKNKPIMVYIHGGSYRRGSTTTPLYDGYNLVEKYPDIIFASIEYRLGIYGFINLSSFEGGENYKTSNILGLLDQICALKWIQKNIKNFGGDPEKVTLIGQSAGAGSISLLPLLDGTEGLFKRIIAQSGSLSLTFSPQESKKIVEKLKEKLGSSKMEDLLSLSEEELIKINKDIINYSSYPERDGINLPIDLYSEYKSGKGKNIDMLLGSNQDEVRYWIKSMGYYTNFISGEVIFKLGFPILFETDLKKISLEDKQNAYDFKKIQSGEKLWKIAEFYNEAVFRIPMNKQAEYHSDAGGNTYVYYWNYPGKNKEMGAYHGVEIPFVLNNLKESPDVGDKVNIDFVNEVQDMWVNFARTGNPSTTKNTWEKYNSDTRKTMILGEEIKMEEDYKSEQRELIEPLLKYYINGNFLQMSYDVFQVYKIATVAVSSLVIIGLILRKFKVEKNYGKLQNSIT